MSINSSGRNRTYLPLVSIIIPVCNGSNYLHKAIDSALGQTYKNYEVIVVNDGSTDSTEKIAKEYGDKVIYFKKRNGGVSSALNLGIKKAKGKYISWLSHDDEYVLNKIEKQIDVLNKLSENKRNNVVLFSNYQLIDENSQVVENCNIEKVHKLKKFSCHLYPVMKGLVYGCTLLISKDSFEKFGYFDESLYTSQDYDMWFRLFPKSHIHFQPDYLLKSRKHLLQGSCSQRANDESNSLWIKMLSEVSDKDKISIDGSVLNFYKENYKLMKRVGYYKAAEYSQSYIKKLRQPFFSKIGGVFRKLF